MTTTDNTQPTSLSLALSDEQQMLLTTAREFVADKVPALRLRALRGDSGPGFDRSVWSQIAELGWLGLHIPEEHGGMGLGFFDLCLVLEACGRELMPEPLVSTLLLGAQTLRLSGDEAQQARWLPRIVAGETIVAVATDPRSVVAASKGDGFSLTGRCAHVFDAHAADVLLIPARRGGEMTLFAVVPNAPGCTVTRQHRMDHHPSSVVVLKDVFVDASSLVGGQGAGEKTLAAVLDRARIGVAALLLGASERAFERTIDYLKQREQFGVPIGQFQALQHRAARLYIDIALMRSSVYAAARTVDDDPARIPQMAALAKGVASDAACAVAKEAVQMHGGIGVTDEHDIGFYLKRVHALAALFGNATQQRRRWATEHGY